VALAQAVRRRRSVYRVLYEVELASSRHGRREDDSSITCFN
jgi:hypothetical protein